MKNWEKGTKQMIKKGIAAVMAAILFAGNLACYHSPVIAAGKSNLLEDGGFEGDFGNDGIWGIGSDDSGDYWEYATVEQYEYSKDEWMLPKEGDKCLKYWISDQASESHSITVSQWVELDAGSYILSAFAMGDTTSRVTVQANAVTGAAVSLTGYNNWHELTLEFDIDTQGWYEMEALITGEPDAWGYLDKIVLKHKEDEEDTAVNAGIFVDKVTDMGDDFICGVDVSSYITLIDSGVSFYDWDGRALDEQGFFDLLADSGVNTVRIRVWNDPYDAQGNGYGGGNNDLEKAVRMGQWATNAGMQVSIDFHYSDFWADPAKQMVPKAWEGMTVPEKEDALYEYTKTSLQTLISAGVDVDMVQIGNETNGAMAGETNFTNVCTLMKAGSRAVREIDSDILIAVHFTDPQKNTPLNQAALLAQNLVDYDVLATSYYPFWHGSMSNLTGMLKQVVTAYGKKVLVAETSYVYTLADGDGFDNTISRAADLTDGYTASVQGQAREVRDVMQAVTEVGEEGIGVIYWEPAWIPVPGENKAERSVLWENYGSGWASSYAAEYDAEDAGAWYGGSSWDNQAMFDFEGYPLESLKVYQYAKTGAVAELEVESIESPAVEITLGNTPVIPEKVTVTYNDATTRDILAAWDEEEIEDILSEGVGEYIIHGVIILDEEEYEVTCILIVLAENYVKNSGFELDDNGDWILTGNAVSIKPDSSNVRTGDYCLHFYSETPVSFTAEQEITGLKEGYYTLSSYLQGGAAGSEPEFVLYAKTQSNVWETGTGVNGWKNWSHPVLDEIEVQEGEILTIGIRVEAAAGAWGSWDDFYLSFTGEFENPGTKEPDTKEPVSDSDNSYEPVIQEKAVSVPASGKPNIAASANDPGDTTGTWKLDANGWWYQKKDLAYPADSWLKVNGQWYMFGKDGYMKTGWQQTADGSWFYFDDKNGNMTTGWKQTDDGKWYFLDKQKGEMANGWLKTSDGKWYFLDSRNGDMKTGWLKTSDGKWYFLDSQNGDMKTGWLKAQDGKWYFLQKDGSCAMNATTPDGYRVNENGAWIE